MGSCLSFESRSPLPNSPLGVKKRKNTKKKNSGSRSSSFECKREDLLHRIPGRMFLNGSSEMASLYTQQGKKGTNQDAMIVWENFGSRSDTVFCGVFDGHGPYGHLVARRVRDSLPLKLSSHWEGNSKSEINVNNNAADNMNAESTSLLSAVDEDEEEGRVSNDELDKNRDIFQDLKQLFLKAFKVMDRELKLHTNLDSFCSGTTAVTLIKQGQHLVIGNVGDSRAVLGTRDKDNAITAVQLTVDLKPSLPKEAERIRRCRGRVFALHDEPEVSRVWLPNNDSPGLAMARAFGDFCLKDFGLISIPEITYRCLSDKDEFVVLATDGVWDVLSNEEVVNVVSSAPSRALAARSLVDQAVRAWRYKYPTSKVDDCAVVCFFLDTSMNDVSKANWKKEVISIDHSIKKVEANPIPAKLDDSGTTRKVVEERKEESEDEDEEDEEDEESGEYEEPGSEWSALEGVARVNTLLTLPRFDPGKERKGGGP